MGRIQSDINAALGAGAALAGVKALKQGYETSVSKQEETNEALKNIQESIDQKQLTANVQAQLEGPDSKPALPPGSSDVIGPGDALLDDPTEDKYIDLEEYHIPGGDNMPDLNGFATEKEASDTLNDWGESMLKKLEKINQRLDQKLPRSEQIAKEANSRVDQMKKALKAQQDRKNKFMKYTESKLLGKPKFKKEE